MYRLWMVVLGIAAWTLSFSSADAQQLMEASKLAAYRASLPVLEDDDTNKLFHSDEVIWYTTREMPPAYQHQAGPPIVPSGYTSNATFHSPSYNISGDPSDSGKPLHGNAGNEFPWTVGKPGGAHSAVGVSSIKGFYFPKPALVFRRAVPGRVRTGNTTNILDWVFADDTVFFEVIYQRIGDDDVPFEVRLRRKAGADWEFDVFRLFASAEDLADALEELGPGKLRAEAIADLRADNELPYERLVDSRHTTRHAFDESTYIYNLPRILTADILAFSDRTFVSCLGIPFKGEAYAPSNSKDTVNLVPPKYHGAFVTPTGTSSDCMNCHESANRHATRFQHPRGWYGRTPGSYSDGINSWHPVEPRSISYSGGIIPVRLRQSFIDHGLIEMAGRTLPEGYQFTEGMMR